jgi:Ca2+-binding EF-hand superfamily protein
MQPLRILEHHTREEIRQWYDDADESGDGKLTVNEFFEWSLHKSKVGGAAVLEQVFRKYDADGGSSLNADEFKRMATDLGFGHAAAEVFAVLDYDRSGSISFKEMLASLKTTTPRNMETKKLLFGCIWSWGMDETSASDFRKKVDTRKWRIRSSEAPAVYHELRALLQSSGAAHPRLTYICIDCARRCSHAILGAHQSMHNWRGARVCVLLPGAQVHDLAIIFDEDVSAKVTIDSVEFVNILRKQWGFRGMPHVLDEVTSLDLTRHGLAGPAGRFMPRTCLYRSRPNATPNPSTLQADSGQPEPRTTSP